MRVFYTKQITVYRLNDSSSKETYLENGFIRGAIMPLTAESAFLTEGNPAQSYKLFTDYESDLKVTDKISYEGTDYTITGIQQFDFGAMRRKEALIQKFNS